MAERLTKLPTTSEELYAEFEKQIEKTPKIFDSFELVTGNGNTPLADKVGEILGKRAHRAVIGYFADGTPQIKIPVNVRRREVVFMQSEAPNPALRVAERQKSVDAARRASADRISVVLPWMTDGRQDRKTGSREPISIARSARDLVSAGAQSILTVDIHNEASMGAIDQPWDNIYGSPALIAAIEATGMTDIDIATADVGGAKRGEPVLNRLAIAKNLVIVYKRHTENPNETEALFIAGNVEGRDLWVVEDMIDTGGSAINAARIYKDKGARSVNIVATHGLFSRKDGQSAVEKLENSEYDRVIITDSILPDKKTQREIAQSKKIKEATIAPLLAKAIMCNLTGESIGERVID